MGLSLAQKRIFFIAPKLLAAPSLLASLFISIQFFRFKFGKSSTYDRILVCMSLIDVFTSTAYLLGTLPIPSGSATYLSSGNENTCKAQAFVIQFGLAIPFYNFFLGIYYLLVVAHGWKERALLRIEPFMHVIALSAGLGTSISALVLDLFHDSNLWCWIAANPEMNNNFNIFRWFLFYGPLWLCIFGVTVVMALMVMSVKKTAGNSQKYAKNSISLVKQVANQACFYVLAFYLTWTFATISRIFQAATGNIPFPLAVLFAFTLPGQGLWNFLVYMRPLYLRYRKEKAKSSVQATTTSTKFNIKKPEEDSRDEDMYVISNGNEKYISPSALEEFTDDPAFQLSQKNTEMNNEVSLQQISHVQKAEEDDRAEDFDINSSVKEPNIGLNRFGSCLSDPALLLSQI